jgi:hypothetical protein
MVNRQTRKPPENPYRTAASSDQLGPANRIAYDIVAARRDLLPSVERIMNAGLGEDATLRAITLFRDSLTAINNPNRDPRVVIARCSAVSRKPRPPAPEA